jgi:hypothetical protein
VVAVPSGWSDWLPVDFVVPNQKDWRESEDNSYTAVKQHSNDAFAWSKEIFEGDLIINLELSSTVSDSEGCVIVYGSGYEFSLGSLIFCIETEFYQIEKNTLYHEGENFLAYHESNLDFKDQTYSTTIEITD